MRAPPIGFLRERFVALSASPRLILTDVIDGSPDHEPMFRFTVDGDAQARSFVAPLSQLSFGRSVRLARPRWPLDAFCLTSVVARNFTQFCRMGALAVPIFCISANWLHERTELA